MTIAERKLAKVYYQDREVRYIDISFDDSRSDGSYYKLMIGPAIDISGKDQVMTLDYGLINSKDDGSKKESPIVYWDVKNHLDKIETKHDVTGIMIKWLSPNSNNSGFSIKSSLFIPMARIFHVSVDDPVYDNDEESELKEMLK